MSSGVDDTDETNPAESTLDGVMSFVDSVSEDLHGDDGPWTIRVQVAPDRAQGLTLEIGKRLPALATAFREPKRQDVVCITFDTRVISLIAEMVLASDGLYLGRG